MKKKTRKEVREARAEILKSSDVKSVINKGDKRITSSSRVCGVCGCPLSGINYVTGKVLSKQKHYHIQYSKYLYIGLCHDISNCYRNLNI